MLSILLSTYPEELFPIFENLKFFFRFLSEKVSAFCLEPFRQGCQNAIPRVWENFLRKMNWFEKKVFSYFFLQFERKIFGFLLLFFEAWISKVHSACPEKNFEEKSFSNYIICWNFWVFFSIFSGFRWKKRKQCCQNCVLRVQMNLFGFENLFWNNVKLWFFPVSEQKHFFVWRETFSAGFSKLLSPCPRELSSKKLIYIEKILLLLLILVLWAETYQTFGKKFLAELLKQHSSCPNGSFEVKIFLSKLNLFINIVKHWAKTCWFLAKNVRHCCQSCILRVEENFWLKIK